MGPRSANIQPGCLRQRKGRKRKKQETLKSQHKGIERKYRILYSFQSTRRTHRLSTFFASTFASYININQCHHSRDRRSAVNKLFIKSVSDQVLKLFFWILDFGFPINFHFFLWISISVDFHFSRFLWISISNFWISNF